MKFHLPTKIIFGILAIMIVATLIFLLKDYPKLKAGQQGAAPVATTSVGDQAPANQQAGTSPVASPDGEIVINTPGQNQVVSTPLEFSGKAKGSWFFEAIFPVKLLDADGTLLGYGPATAQGAWQTTDFVNFSGSLVFAKPTGQTGSLVFENDNPSGLPANHKEFSLPVRFVQDQANGSTCAPDLADCGGNPELCMTENKNAVCD